VRAGLARISGSAEYVAVHDAARPLVTPEQIERVFDLCREHGGAALAEPIIDTVKRATEEGFVSASIERDQLYAMQTPQIFSRARLEQAYEAIVAEKISITDEVSALEHLNHKVVLVPNEEYNFKITYPADLPLAAFVIRQRQGLEGVKV
jgi:2-C-methyl-D-erythritol 4-phosphate cytidylyltransferase